MSVHEIGHHAPKWKVIRQEEEPDLDENGDKTTMHHVTFVTEHGHESTVSLPDRVFTAHNVAREIHAKAHEIGLVHDLTSETQIAPPQPA